MTTDVTLYTARTLDDTMTLGKVLAQSGYFADSREAAQAVVKILAGQELGFGPIAWSRYCHAGRASSAAERTAPSNRRFSSSAPQAYRCFE